MIDFTYMIVECNYQISFCDDCASAQIAAFLKLILK